MVDKSTIQNVAKLAKLEFREDEIDMIVKKLDNVLSYVKMLDEVNVDNVDITYNPIDLKNAFREDNVGKSLDREKVLQNAPDKEMGCFKVPKVLD
ncbi:aspartyl/glutamyl-tRNA(Asn/Gln) amidotransferase subunit C [Alkalithermobacter thermoalcaliphilus JW-YL-7 = DSM 7308]|uniref:Aspartyl/glutamyl-tRNA(Asn/Gln) amidotransferase subunit C n=1 Tax=Alkalithermobacter thermoalcaliphilus JW-YL-7 = DSM 7308 TaxID=1121328 RepID=A0A150FTM4_CLOPD|nr:Aspartyl/glutamyl-tRNA(Asn/Gln) amidotransferase subunit C [[Clostridium] paradoxum JW-YL-7 = DSM 7308]SHK35313.1 aspartyl/glutamyl-tRNA(Asn/Gln) amidotransferase subunit C [[Clostridium] paradoxum JW-YL-7 = DSM 7308]